MSASYHGMSILGSVVNNQLTTKALYTQSIDIVVRLLYSFSLLGDASTVGGLYRLDSFTRLYSKYTRQRDVADLHCLRGQPARRRC